jgi:hypothetical protein
MAVTVGVPPLIATGLLREPAQFSWLLGGRPLGGLFYFRSPTPSWFAGSLAVKLRKRSTHGKP